MKKILVASILLTLVVSSGAFGRSPRWNALGGDHRFIIDDENYSIYPGRVTLFGNTLFVIPVPKADIKEFSDQRYFVDNGIVSGALLNVTNSMTLAFHYNLDSAGDKNLRTALAGLPRPDDELDEAKRELRKQDFGTPGWLKAKKVVGRINQNNRMADLDIKPFPDLFWGMKMGNVSLGARLAVAMDSSSDAASTTEEPIMDEKGVVAIAKTTKPVEEITASAKALDLSLGATMYKTPVGDLDLGLSLGTQNFTGDDPNDALKIESTGGMDLAFNARLNKLCKEEKRTLISLLSLNIGSVPSAAYDIEAAPDVTEASYTKGDIGIGFRNKIREKGFVLAGVVGGYGATTYTPTTTIEKEPAEEGGEVTLETKELLETTDTSLNATVLAGCEFPITKWLIVRGGVNAKFAAITDEVATREETEQYLAGIENITKDVVGQRKSTSADYYYNMGIRTIFGGLIVDVLLARNIVHRGPYFLTGAADNWATNVCVTYSF